MAEEVQYSSGGDSATNKRKYDDQSTPPPPSSGGRRATGFSAPISSQSPDSAPSYNNVPPPLDDIQLAKQRAQEIAARLFNNVEAKRPRVENGGSGGYDSSDGKGFSSGPTGSTSISNSFYRFCDFDAFCLLGPDCFCFIPPIMFTFECVYIIHVFIYAYKF